MYDMLMKATNLDRAILIADGYLGMGQCMGEEGVLRVRGYAEDEEGRLYGCKETSIALLEPGSNTVTLKTDSVVRVYLDATLSSYDFGLHSYEPFESIVASCDKASRRHASLALALWAALESDLFRFAYDTSFTASLEGIKGSDEWLRFAGLNRRYRAIVRALVPYGVVPPSWNAWLRETGPEAAPTGRATRMLERMLTRPIASIEDTLLACARNEGST